MGAMQALFCPHGASVGNALTTELLSGRWKVFRAGVAFAKMSGVRHLDAPLRGFLAAGGRCTVSVGIDHGGTSFEALSQLLGAVYLGGDLYIVHESASGSPTFHPKVYLFADGASPPARVRVIIGSANLTEGGLYTNHEASFAWEADLRENAAARSTAKAVLDELDRWSSTDNGLCIRADTQVLLDLHGDGKLPTERQIAQMRRPEEAGGRSSTRGRRGYLGGLRAQPKPKAPRAGRLGAPAVASPRPSTEAEALPKAGGRSSSRGAPTPGANTIGRKRALHRVLVIDINQGQRKTECFLAKAPIEEDPGFFGWEWRFTNLTQLKSSRGVAQLCWVPAVDLALRDGQGTLTPPSHAKIRLVRHVNPRPGESSGSEDLRLGVPADILRRLTGGCILKMYRKPNRRVEYLLEFLTPGSPQWSEARAVAVRPLPGSPRKFGWI